MLPAAWLGPTTLCDPDVTTLRNSCYVGMASPIVLRCSSRRLGHYVAPLQGPSIGMATDRARLARILHWLTYFPANTHMCSLGGEELSLVSVLCELLASRPSALVWSSASLALNLRPVKSCQQRAQIISTGREEDGKVRYSRCKTRFWILSLSLASLILVQSSCSPRN